MQKYIHLVQIVETEKIAANQLRHQLEDQDTEIERLKSEVFPSRWILSHCFMLTVVWLIRVNFNPQLSFYAFNTYMARLLISIRNDSNVSMLKLGKYASIKYQDYRLLKIICAPDVLYLIRYAELTSIFNCFQFN